MATCTPGRTAADQTRHPSRSYRGGCWSDLPRQNLRPALQPQIPHRGYAAAALASEEQQLLNTPVGQRNNRLNVAAFWLARFIASEALAHGDVEAVLLDVAA